MVISDVCDELLGFTQGDRFQVDQPEEYIECFEG